MCPEKDVFFHKRRNLSVLIFRYLSRETLSTVVATMMILLVIFISNQFVHYLNDAAQGKITAKAVFELMSIQVPLLMGFLLPLSLYLGVLLSVGRWCTDHELIALYSCGYSRGQLLRAVVFIGLMVMVVVSCLMLWVEPKMQWQRARIIAQAVNSATLEKIQPGRFQPLSKNNERTFYAKSVSDDHKDMLNVFLANSKLSHKHPGRHEWNVITARTASETKVPGNGRFLVFNQGYRYIGVPGELDYQKVHFNQYKLRVVPSDEDFGLRTETLPTTKLFAMRKKNKDAAAELQWRLALPISVIVLALLAMPLSEINPRSGKFARLFPAILIYIVYANLMIMSRAWIQKGVINEALGMWWVHALFLLLALVLIIWRFNRR